MTPSKYFFDQLDQWGIQGHHFACLPSTNDFIIQNKCLNALVIADQQDSGRGRRENAWQSSQGDLLFSLSLTQAAPPPGYLSICVGLAVLTALAQYSRAKLMFKWPNDIVSFSGQETLKHAGILIETFPYNKDQKPNQCWVIGVGVNVVTQPSALEPSLDREKLLLNIIRAIQQQCLRPKLQPKVMARYHALANQAVRFYEGTIEKQGIVRDIDSQGGLGIEINGDLSYYHHIHSLRAIH